MRRAFIAVILSAFFCAPSFAGAAGFLPAAKNKVAASAVIISPSGTDSGSCPLATPCFSLTYASTKVAAGGAIYARGGSYCFSGEQDMGAVGTASQHISVSAYPGDSAVTFTCGDQSFYGILLRVTSTGAHLNFSNLNFDCGAHAFGAYAAISDTVPAACAAEFSDDAGSNDMFFENVTMQGGRREAYVLNGSPNVLDHMTIVHNAQDNNSSRPACTAAGVKTNCLASGPPPWRTVSGGGGGGWPGATRNNGNVYTVTNSNIYENDGEGALLGGVTVLLQNDTFYDNFSTNVGCDGVSGHCIMESIFSYTTQNAEYERYRFTGGAPAIGISVATEGGVNGEVTITNSVSYGGWFNFSYSNDSSAPQCYSNITVVGNTFANPIGPASSFQENINTDEFGTTCNQRPNPQGNVWENNIAYINNSQPQTNNGAGQTVTFDHNTWFGGSGGSWAGGTGDTTSDPLFAGTIGTSSPTAYQLQSGSPAKGTGVSIGKWTVRDLGNNPRPNGSAQYHMGAWNFP